MGEDSDTKAPYAAAQRRAPSRLERAIEFGEAEDLVADPPTRATLGGLVSPLFPEIRVGSRAHRTAGGKGRRLRALIAAKSVRHRIRKGRNRLAVPWWRVSASRQDRQ